VKEGGVELVGEIVEARDVTLAERGITVMDREEDRSMVMEINKTTTLKIMS